MHHTNRRYMQQAVRYECWDTRHGTIFHGFVFFSDQTTNNLILCKVAMNFLVYIIGLKNPIRMSWTIKLFNLKFNMCSNFGVPGGGTRGGADKGSRLRPVACHEQKGQAIRWSENPLLVCLAWTFSGYMMKWEPCTSVPCMNLFNVW